MIKVRNIYYMLSYAFRTLNEKEAAGYEAEEFEYIDSLFAVILARGIGKQLKRGLGREYQNQAETTVSPKGKLRMADTLKLRAAHKNEVSCERYELAENTYMNQILKSTSLLLLRSKDIAPKHRRQLKTALRYFSDVDALNCRAVSWNRLQYHRNNASYKMLMNICFLVINGMLLSEKDGRMTLSRYVDDQQMHKLYEKFILEYYRKHFPHIRASQAQIEWQTDDGMKKFLPLMRTDIMLEYQGKILIIDAKYYASSMQHHSQYGSETVHSHNLYQIFSYVKNKAAGCRDSVSGMLLYAKTQEHNPDADYRMGGNKISVKTLDLDADFCEIRKQLDGIVHGWAGDSQRLPGTEFLY